MLTARIHRDWAEVRPIWPRLADLGPVWGYPYQTGEWIEAWAETLGRANEGVPLFVVVETDGRPTAFLPLVQRRRYGLIVLEMLGDGTADYHAPLVAGAAFGPEALAALWLALTRSDLVFDLMLLERAAATIAGAPNPFLAWDAIRADHSGHEEQLDGTWEAWAARRFDNKARSNLRRTRKKLAEQGLVEAAYAATVGDGLERLEALLALKHERMAEAGLAQTNALACPALAEFYRTMTRTSLEAGHVRVFTLAVEGEPVALVWGTEAGGRYTSLLSTYAGGRWRPFGPGKLLFDELMRTLFAGGVAWFDFGYGDEPYKDLWCEGLVPLHSAARARTWRGQAYLAARGLRARLRENEALRLTWQRARTLVGARAGQASGSTGESA